ncbi:MAG: phage late control D family protein [Treponema sp.]|nr:phage late control D family protein [Treponema sp.]
MADNTNALALHLAEGACADFYPWDLVLEEGFSQLYRGELTVLSEKKHSLEELSGLLGKGISLTMSQKLGDAKTQRTRYLHGVVTGVRSAGVFSNGKVKDCYSHVLTIEPELARLHFTCLTTPYYRMNPADIFEAILDKYGLKARIEGAYCSRGKYGRNLFFDQSQTSDLDFLRAIAELYGISFTFVHPQTQAGVLGVADLYFSDGETFPLSPLAYSDKREEPRTVNFNFLGFDEGRQVWKMDSWVMTKTIGFEGCKLNASYPNANYGSEQWKWGKTEKGARYAGYSRLFHGYDRQVGTEEVDADITLILDAKRRVAEEAASRWTAGAANLALRPGLILELRHFYGMNDTERITALVTGITLHHRVRWPANLAVRMEGADGEISEVRGECMDWGGGAEKRFCPPLAGFKALDGQW